MYDAGMSGPRSCLAGQLFRVSRPLMPYEAQQRVLAAFLPWSCAIMWGEGGPTLDRRTFFRSVALGSALALTLCAHRASGDQPLNVLFITADDLGYESLGVTGCRAPDITPNIDRLASEGMRFERAHVIATACMPSREAMMTGRYPHRSGAMGFVPIRGDVTTLPEILREAGYYSAIMFKEQHHAPSEKFPWDKTQRTGSRLR